ncbi:hypothetical protein [Paenibacillus thiaminolyticus]|uniref:hypothetical protein n=1 Tax=Paenibacillus thiaminolyticus TaxID=49283 RepID=UPI0026D4C220|nr:hypothetical protein [Paenibacillus thiaminolyticus]
MGQFVGSLLRRFVQRRERFLPRVHPAQQQQYRPLCLQRNAQLPQMARPLGWSLLLALEQRPYIFLLQQRQHLARPFIGPLQQAFFSRSGYRLELYLVVSDHLPVKS